MSISTWDKLMNKPLSEITYMSDHDFVQVELPKTIRIIDKGEYYVIAEDAFGFGKGYSNGWFTWPGLYISKESAKRQVVIEFKLQQVKRRR